MQNVRLIWPVGGISSLRGYSTQVTNQGQKPTTVDARNVRTYDATTGRLRGGSRAGHSKFASAQANGSNPIQLLRHVVRAATVSGASTRTIYLCAIAGGNVYKAQSSGYTLATSGSGALSSSAVYVDAAEAFGILYLVDGTNYKKWTPDTNTVASWAASSGALPSSGSDTAKLAALWRGRVVLAHVKGDEHNWFMSALGNPLDWDYGVTPSVPTMAVSGNNADCGKIGDVVNAMIPFSDDILIFGCDHSIQQMSGDPADGGRIDMLTEAIGMAFGQSWCIDPAGRAWFLGTNGSIYTLAPDSLPQRVSAHIDPLLRNLDLSTTFARLAWNDREKSVHVYLCPSTVGQSRTHYVYDTVTEGWWADSFTSTNHEPRCVHEFDGDTAGDRVVLLGCVDGYVRKMDYSAVNDDGMAVSSYVMLGPYQAENVALQLSQLDIQLSNSSDPLTCAIRSGISAETAATATAGRSFSCTGGHNTDRPLVMGDAHYIRLSNSTSDRDWQFEHGAAVFRPTSQGGWRLFNRGSG